MSFPLPDHILQSPHVAYKQIMTRVKVQQSGAIAEQMSSLPYKLNFGVRMVSLQEIAQAFKADQGLASLLFHSGVREGMLLASLLAEPEKMDDKTAMSWSEALKNIELIEHFSKNLYWRIPGFKDWYTQLDAGNTFQIALANYSFGWYLKKADIQGISIEGILFRMPSQLQADHKIITQSIVFTLQAMVLLNETLRKLAIESAEKMAADCQNGQKGLLEDFLWLNS